MKPIHIFVYFLFALSPVFAQDYSTEKGTGDLAYTIKLGDAANAMSISPDGKTLALGVKDELYFVNLENGELAKHLDFRHYLEGQGMKLDLGFVRGLDYSPDGKLAVALIGGIVLLGKKLKPLWHCEGHPGPGLPTGYEAYGPTNNAYCVWLCGMKRTK